MKILIWLVVIFLLLFFCPVRVSYSAPEPLPKPTLKEYAEQRVLEEFGSGWPEFERIIAKESRWEVFGAHYPVSKKSSAWGLCGTLVKTHKVAPDFKVNPYTQVDWCIEYVKKRHKNPQQALKFHLTHNWF